MPRTVRGCYRNPIGKNLYRALVNGDWLQLFPNSHAYSDAGGVSDHARCLIKLSGVQDESRKPSVFQLLGRR